MPQSLMPQTRRCGRETAAVLVGGVRGVIAVNVLMLLISMAAADSPSPEPVPRDPDTRDPASRDRAAKDAPPRSLPLSELSPRPLVPATRSDRPASRGRDQASGLDRAASRKPSVESPTVSGGSSASVPEGTDEEKFPTWNEVLKAVKSNFDGRKLAGRHDLIARGDVVPLFDVLAKLGWKVEDRDRILDELLPDSHFLVQQLRSQPGQRFMKKVASESLIYDRLDRVSQERGGQALIHDLIRLPDGDRYARQNPGQAVPNLLDLLPKDASGRTRQIRNYWKPTGKIYVRDQFVKRLDASYQAAELAREK